MTNITIKSNRIATALRLALLGFILTVCRAGAQSLLPESLNKACAFVMAGNAPAGSGFFIRMPADKGQWMTYFVTAKHVVDDFNFDAKPSYLRLRLNRSDGKSPGIISVPLSLEGSKPWLQHTNPAVDIAVFPILASWPLDAYEVLVLYCLNTGELIPPDYSQKTCWLIQGFNFAFEETRKLWNVGPGNETITLGLVGALYRPSNPNVIAYRHGRIAAIPDFEIAFDAKGAAKTIVLDSPVINGNSGGPVFVMITETDPDNGTQSTHPHLLGIVSGFLTSWREGVRDGKTGKIDKSKILEDNSGLSLVVPVDYLVEILNLPKAKQFRENASRAGKQLPEFNRRASELQMVVRKARDEKDEVAKAIRKYPKDQVPAELIAKASEKEQQLKRALKELNEFYLASEPLIQVFDRDRQLVKRPVTNAVNRAGGGAAGK